MSHILLGDSLDRLKELETDSIDSVITDPPYGYSFMGKDWDKAVPSVDIWRECLRVLKPGAFCMVMSAPRSDVQNAMISRLMEAGFRLDFTPIYWTYASGFPKAGNIGKLVDKRMGAERTEVIGQYKHPDGNPRYSNHAPTNYGKYKGEAFERDLMAPASDQAKALEGSYAGFQPKPAVEVIIVAMKPLSEKTYVDQALKNGHGVTWLDGGRIPTEDSYATTRSNKRQNYGEYKSEEIMQAPQHDAGRFPANLLVSDTILADHSRFFDLDAWAQTKNIGDEYARTSTINRRSDRDSEGDSGPLTGSRDANPCAESPEFSTLPFLSVPKASKGEKNKGLEDRPDVFRKTLDGGSMAMEGKRTEDPTGSWTKNSHPTVKPLKLMSYLITLTSRPGDTVLDPFVGSGTTAVAAEQLGRIGIGIEREEEYAEIARARLNHVKPQLSVEKPEPTEMTLEEIETVEQTRLL